MKYKNSRKVIAFYIIFLIFYSFLKNGLNLKQKLNHVKASSQEKANNFEQNQTFLEKDKNFKKVEEFLKEEDFKNFFKTIIEEDENLKNLEQKIEQEALNNKLENAEFLVKLQKKLEFLTSLLNYYAAWQKSAKTCKEFLKDYKNTIENLKTLYIEKEDFFNAAFLINKLTNILLYFSNKKDVNFKFRVKLAKHFILALGNFKKQLAEKDKDFSNQKTGFEKFSYLFKKFEISNFLDYIANLKDEDVKIDDNNFIEDLSFLEFFGEIEQERINFKKNQVKELELEQFFITNVQAKCFNKIYLDEDEKNWKKEYLIEEINCNQLTIDELNLKKQNLIGMVIDDFSQKLNSSKFDFNLFGSAKKGEILKEFELFQNLFSKEETLKSFKIKSSLKKFANQFKYDDLGEKSFELEKLDFAPFEENLLNFLENSAEDVAKKQTEKFEKAFSVVENLAKKLKKGLELKEEENIKKAVEKILKEKKETFKKTLEKELPIKESQIKLYEFKEGLKKGLIKKQIENFQENLALKIQEILKNEMQELEKALSEELKKQKGNLKQINKWQEYFKKELIRWGEDLIKEIESECYYNKEKFEQEEKELKKRIEKLKELNGADENLKKEFQNKLKSLQECLKKDLSELQKKVDQIKQQQQVLITNLTKEFKANLKKVTIKQQQKEINKLQEDLMFKTQEILEKGMQELQTTLKEKRKKQEKNFKELKTWQKVSQQQIDVCQEVLKKFQEDLEKELNIMQEELKKIPKGLITQYENLKKYKIELKNNLEKSLEKIQESYKKCIDELKENQQNYSKECNQCVENLQEIQKKCLVSLKQKCNQCVVDKLKKKK